MVAFIFWIHAIAAEVIGKKPWVRNIIRNLNFHKVFNGEN